MTTKLKLPWLMPRVAVLELHGTIGGAIRSQQYVPAIRGLREDKRVRAVVLDIDSPGGSASVSDYLYNEIRKLAAKKPVVAFIRGTGASGGYYLAAAAPHIIAQRAAIVGSIGVITIRPVAVDLMEKVGLRVNVAKTGSLKGAGLPFTEPTEEERAKDQRLVDQFFDLFIRVVAEGRHMPEETVRGWATGEVFWAQEALEKGLIDELGDQERATALAAEQARIPEKVTRVRPRRNPLMVRLTGQATRAAIHALATELRRTESERVQFR